jgi:hypothetical protein
VRLIVAGRGYQRTICGDSVAVTVADFDGGCPISFPDVYLVIGTLEAVVHEPLPRGRKRTEVNGILQIACTGVAGALDAHLDLEAHAFQQHPACSGDVLKYQLRRCARHNAVLSRKRGGVQAGVIAQQAGRVPNLFAIGRPAETAASGVDRRQALEVAFTVDHRDRAAVIGNHRMIDKGNMLTIRTDAHVIDPAWRFVQHLAYGIFQPLFAAFTAYHGEILAIASDVGLVNVLQDGPRRAAVQRHAGEGAAL